MLISKHYNLAGCLVLLLGKLTNGDNEMNKAFKKYGKADFESIIPNRSKTYFTLKNKGIDYKKPNQNKKIALTFEGVESAMLSEVDFIDDLKMIEAIL